MNSKNKIKELPDTPFPGIDPFGYAERHVFFAREAESRALFRLIVIHRGVLLYSDSGIGKSSIINAGLIPRAIEEGFQPERVRVQPKENEEVIVERISIHGDGGTPYLPSNFFTDQDHQREVLSVERFTDTVKANAKSIRQLLIFDQFEEWFTLFEEGVTQSRAAEAKIAQEKIRDGIISLLTDQQLPVKILLVLREDYLAKLTPFFLRYPNLPDQYLRLEPLYGAAIGRIIRGPFDNFPQIYHPEIPVTLAETIQNEFEQRSGGEDIRLSEVQIVCKTLYESRLEGKALADYFIDAGGVKGILEHYLKSALDSLPPEQRDPAIGLLSRMVTTAGTRNVICGDDVIGRVESEDKIEHRVLEITLTHLEQVTKLVRRERRREVYYYEIASEFLVEWIQAKAKQRAEQKRVEATEKALQEQKRRAEEQARRAARERRRTIIVVSLSSLLFVVVLCALYLVYKNRDQRKEMLIKQQQYQVTQDSLKIVGLLAETANLRIEDAERRAVIQTENANEQKRLREKSDSLLIITKKSLQEINRLRRISKARNLALIAPLQQSSQDSDHKKLGLLLAREAYRFNKANDEHFPDEVYQGLRQTLNDADSLAGGPTVRIGYQDWARSLAINSNGDIASGGADGKIYIWKLVANRSGADVLNITKTLFDKTEKTNALVGIRSIVISPTKDVLIACGEDSIVDIWRDYRNSGAPRHLVGHRGKVWTLTISPDGGTLVSAGDDSALYLWNMHSLDDPSHALIQKVRLSNRVRSVTYSQDGKMLVAGMDDGKINFWNPRNMQQLRAPLEHSSSVRSVILHPKNAQLVAGLADGKVWLWDISRRNPVGNLLSSHDDRVNCLSFSKQGDLLASASADGTIRLWYWNDRKAGPIILRDHRKWVWSVGFSPNGDRLLSCGSDGTIRSWLTRLDHLAGRVGAKVDRELSNEEWDRYVGKEFDRTPPKK